MSYEIKGHGFVLRLIRSQEADVILRILTSTGEKISVFARAGLKSKKRFGGALQPLSHISFRGTRRPNQDLVTLEEATSDYDFKNIRSSMETLVVSSYMAEITEMGTHDGLDNPEVYNLLGAALKALDMGLKVDGVMRQFETKLFFLLGLLPKLSQCSKCHVEGVDLFLEPYTSLVTCRDCGIQSLSITCDTQRTIHNFLSLSILKNNFTDDEIRRVGPITNAFIKSQWSQKIKSLQVLNSLKLFR